MPWQKGQKINACDQWSKVGPSTSGWMAQDQQSYLDVETEGKVGAISRLRLDS